MDADYKIECKAGLCVVELRYGTYTSELAELVMQHLEKNSYVLGVWSGEITLADVPTEWQEEIQRRVDERIAEQGAADQQEISADEALNIILGGDSE